MKKGAMSFQMILLILAVMALIAIAVFIIAKTSSGKEFFAKLIKSFMGKYGIS